MKPLATAIFAAAIVTGVNAQVNFGAGGYTQNFDTPALASQTSQGTNWVNNTTIAGWYAETSFGSITNYRVGAGGVNNGSLYSYGASSSSDRALGSLGSSSYNGIAYGVRLVNGGETTIDDLSVSYVGEQWRNGAPNPAAAHSLVFSYRVSSSPITSPDWAGAETWTAVPSLNFTGPITGGTAGGLDGNAAENRIALTGTISGLAWAPGTELFLRWFDVNDTSNDHGLGIDDFSAAVPEPTTAGLLALGLALMFSARKSR